MTPSSATRLSTPLEPMIAVLTAPERIRKPTHDDEARSGSSLRPVRADHVHRQAADQVVAVLRSCRTSSGMSITARKLIAAVSTRL